MDVPLDQTIEAATNQIIGAAFEVSNALGHGFLEAVYRRALLHELRLREMTVTEEVRFDVSYKAASVGTYVADIVIDNAVVVELKAIESLNHQHIGQVLNYLKASGLRVGLLLNFGRPRLEIRRVLL